MRRRWRRLGTVEKIGIITVIVGILALPPAYFGLFLISRHPPNKGDHQVDNTNTARAPTNQPSGPSTSSTPTSEVSKSPTPPALVSKYLSEAPSIDNAPGEYPATGSISSAIMWPMPASISGDSYPQSVVILGGSDPVTYILGRRFRRLEGVVGITDDSDVGANARIEVVADGRRIFRQWMRTGQGSQLKLNIIGVNELKLRCAGATSGPVAKCGFGDAEVIGS